MILTPECVLAYKELMLNPQKHNLNIPSLFEIFEKSKTPIPKDVLYKEYIEIIKKPLPKVIFYIVMDEFFEIQKTEDGCGGYCVKNLKLNK